MEQPQEVPNVIKSDLQLNTHILTIDGLFAGFSFTGVLQVLSYGNLSFLLFVSVGFLIFATVLFALRINIAIRIIACIYTAADLQALAQCSSYKNLVIAGRWIELTGIFAFWTSLAPIAFHFGYIFGIITSTILLGAWIAYAKVIRVWAKINVKIPQIKETSSLH